MPHPGPPDYLYTMNIVSINKEAYSLSYDNTTTMHIGKYPRMIKSLFAVYCNIMFHVAEAKIIRHINKALHDETLAHFSVPKRKSAGKKGSIGLVRYTTMSGSKQ